MTLKDRGNIKWTSLMLVEHRQKLKELIEDDKKQSRPELDEQALIEMDYLLQVALREGLLLRITCYDKGFFHHFTGRIEKYLPHKRQLVLKDSKRKILNITDIVEIERKE